MTLREAIDLLSIAARSSTWQGADPSLAQGLLDVLHSERAEFERLQRIWLMSPEAAQRLNGYRELGEKCAELERERDEARAEVERLRVEHAKRYDERDCALYKVEQLKHEVTVLEQALESSGFADNEPPHPGSGRLLSASPVLRDPKPTPPVDVPNLGPRSPADLTGKPRG